MSLEDIPRDIYTQIFLDYLTIEDIIKFSSASSFTRSIFTTSKNQIWKRIAERDAYPLGHKQKWQSWPGFLKQYRPHSTHLKNDDVEPIVIDNGTQYTKIGFSGEDLPRCRFSTIIGRPKTDQALIGINTKESYVGPEATAKRGILRLSRPIEHGIVINWDDMEKIWHEGFYNQLNIAPEEHPVLLTESSKNPKANKEKMTQIMFETFNTPVLRIVDPNVLSTYASGRTTALILNVGAGVISCTPIYDGYCKNNVVKRMGGIDLTNYLMDLLNERGYFFEKTSEFQMIDEVKRKYGRIKFGEERISKTQITLPDGQPLTFSNEIERALEGLFSPSLLGRECKGIHELIDNCIFSVDIDCRRDLYSNIVLVGGETSYPNFQERLRRDLEILAPSLFLKISISNHQNIYSPWIGGSILCNLNIFQQMWISKEEYDESGSFYHIRKLF